MALNALQGLLLSYRIFEMKIQPNSLLQVSPLWLCLFQWSSLIFLGLLIYGQSFGFGFVFDDDQFIVNNPYIHNLSKVHEIEQALPLTRLVGIYTFALNYHFHGLNPTGYHLFNVVLHLVVTGLVWALANLLFKIVGKEPKQLPFFMALLFLVHPLQTQAVTYISQRFESLATLFYLTTIYCYLSARISKDMLSKVILFLIAAVSAFLGIMTKEVAITIPLMLLACEWILLPSKNPSAKSSRNLMISVGGVLFLLVFLKLLRSGFNMFITALPSQSHDGDTIVLGNYLLTQMRVFLTFVRLFFVPYPQNVDYDYPLSVSIIDPLLTLVGAGLVSFLILAMIRIRHKWPLISFGLAWVLITFSINLAPRANVIWEHKFYLMSFGFLIATVSVLANLIHKRSSLIFIVCAVTAGFTFLSFQRNHIWQNDFTLWEDGIKRSPNKVRVYVDLAKAKGTHGQLQQAITLLTQKLSVTPNHYGSLMARAGLQYRLGNYDLATEDLRQAVIVRPNFIDFYKLSLIYSEQKQMDKALDALNTSILLNDNFLPAYIDRAMIFVQKKNYIFAVGDLVKAQKIQPQNKVIQNNIEYCFSKLRVQKSP